MFDVSRNNYPHVSGSHFPSEYVAGSIQYTFLCEKGQLPNCWFTTPEVCQVSSPEMENIFLQVVSRAQSREKIELSIDTSTTSSFNDLENFGPAQNYRSTDMSTTPSMTTPSIEEITAQIFLSDVPNIPVTVQATQLPSRIERQRGFGSEIQNLPENVIETIIECALFLNFCSTL